MATLIPDPDEFAETLKTVLDLSDRPRDIKIVSVQAIELPDEVLERFNRFQEQGPEDSEPQPQKRRPGRPRKNPLPEEQA